MYVLIQVKMISEVFKEIFMYGMNNLGLKYEAFNR